MILGWVCVFVQAVRLASATWEALVE